MTAKPHPVLEVKRSEERSSWCRLCREGFRRGRTRRPLGTWQEASAKPLEAAASQRRIGSGWSQLPPAEQPADAVKAGREPAELLRVTERRAKRIAASGQLLRSEADTGAEACGLAVVSDGVCLSEGNRS